MVTGRDRKTYRLKAQACERQDVLIKQKSRLKIARLAANADDIIMDSLLDPCVPDDGVFRYQVWKLLDDTGWTPSSVARYLNHESRAMRRICSRLAAPHDRVSMTGTQLKYLRITVAKLDPPLWA